MVRDCLKKVVSYSKNTKFEIEVKTTDRELFSQPHILVCFVRGFFCYNFTDLNYKNTIYFRETRAKKLSKTSYFISNIKKRTILAKGMTL